MTFPRSLDDKVTVATIEPSIRTELLVPLMRELLELNLMLRGSVRVGIGGEAVIAMAIRPLTEMERDEFSSCIFSVMSVADQIDDMLLEKYGGTAKQRQSA